jgi:hypothetical protein
MIGCVIDSLREKFSVLRMEEAIDSIIEWEDE